MLAKLLSKYISKLKGREYRIDSNIPDGYLWNLAITRVRMKIRGVISRTNYKSAPFIGSNVIIRCRRKIYFGTSNTIERDCFIDALSQEGITFGNNVSLGRSSSVECTGNLQTLGKGLKVGNDVGLGSHNFFGCAGGISIGDDTIIGNYVSFHSENHNYKDPHSPIRLQGVSHAGIVIGRNCWIGAKVTVLDGVIVEDGCIIAAGSVLTAGNYTRDKIFGGVPAKQIQTRFNNNE
ncbi:acyltransferase [Flavitalea antarctica]